VKASSTEGSGYIFMSPDHLWARYLPGIVAAAVAGGIVYPARRSRKIRATMLATLVGLLCMEAEYWVAHGFPASDVPFFLAATGVTLAAFIVGTIGGLLLGVVGLGFFSYVNLRYGAPYLLDYVMPTLYAVLMFYSRRELGWLRPGILHAGFLEGIWFILLQVLAVWRTSHLLKWRWLTGGPW